MLKTHIFHYWSILHIYDDGVDWFNGKNQEYTAMQGKIIFITVTSYMSAMASQITGVSILRFNVCSGADQRNIEAPRHWLFLSGIYWWPVDSPPVTDGFPSESIAENVSIWWCQHVPDMIKLRQIKSDRILNPVTFHSSITAICCLTNNKCSTYTLYVIEFDLITISLIIWAWTLTRPFK